MTLGAVDNAREEPLFPALLRAFPLSSILIIDFYRVLFVPWMLTSVSSPFMDSEVLLEKSWPGHSGCG